MNIKKLLSTHMLSVTLSTAMLTLTTGSFAHAEYPEKPIKIVVGFGAGGGTDFDAGFINTMAGDCGKQTWRGRNCGCIQIKTSRTRRLYDWHGGLFNLLACPSPLQENQIWHQ